MITNAQLILFGAFMSGIGLIFICVAPRASRRQSIRWGIASAVWGLWCLMCGLFKIFKGVGHPLFSDDVRFILFSVLGIVGLICLLVADCGRKGNEQ
jgi:hypothetical protein